MENLSENEKMQENRPQYTVKWTENGLIQLLLVHFYYLISFGFVK